MAAAAQNANTLHNHVRTEAFYFIIEEIGRMRVGEETLTIPALNGVLVGPSMETARFCELPRCMANPEA